MEKNNRIEYIYYRTIERIIDKNNVKSLYLNVCIYKNIYKNSTLIDIEVDAIYSNLYPLEQSPVVFSGVDDFIEYITITELEYELLVDLYKTDVKAFVLYRRVFNGGKG